MARRSDHSREELKEMVIDIAEQMIDAYGIAGLSTRKIATEMGYTVGTIYLIFKNLDELITEVNLRTLRQLEREISEMVQGESDPQSSISIIARTYLNYARTRTRRWRVVFDHQLGGDEVFPNHYHQQVAHLFALIEAPLREMHQGASDTEIVKEARALWASVHGLAMLTVGEKLNPNDAEAEEVLDLILNRIVGSDANGGRV